MLVDEALMRELDEMSTFVPLADIRAMQHAFLSVRLFAS
jgi:urease accessory protein UreF